MLFESETNYCVLFCWFSQPVYRYSLLLHECFDSEELDFSCVYRQGDGLKGTCYEQGRRVQ